MRLKRWIIAVLAVSVIGALFAAFALPAYQTYKWCDPISGSMKTQTFWALGITAGARIDVSPLERRLRQIGFTWEQHWSLLDADWFTLFGRPTLFEDGITPPILQLFPRQDDFVRASTDDEIRAFAQTMQMGTEDQRNAAVLSAIDKSLNAAGYGSEMTNNEKLQ